ncbi:MAG: hypothetical protein AB7Q00_09225 [Phycisphaerales bacterium]
MWMHRLKRFLAVGALAFAILTGVQLLKGHDLLSAARFAGLWSVIAATVFVATGMYNARQSIDCPLCNEPKMPSRPPRN